MSLLHAANASRESEAARLISLTAWENVSLHLWSVATKKKKNYQPPRN